MFELPPRLKQLIEAGVWPSAAHGPNMMEQQTRPFISADRVRRFAEEESVICLQPPPFPTLAKVVSFGPAGYWERFYALDQIDPERALVIGDFGIGSDSLAILNYTTNSSNPPVFRLRWSRGGTANEWVEGARDFDEFAAMLGLELPT